MGFEAAAPADRAGSNPPLGGARRLHVALSALPHRCHNRRHTPTCVSLVPLLSSSTSGAMPFEREIIACRGSLFETIDSSASAAAAWASAFVAPLLPASKPPESHMINVGTPPALAIAAWLAFEPWHIFATAVRSRT